MSNLNPSHIRSLIAAADRVFGDQDRVDRHPFVYSDALTFGDLRALLDVYEAACAWADMVHWTDTKPQEQTLIAAVNKARGK